MGEVTQAVNSTLDLETVLSTIVTKAVQLSGTDAGAIYVFDATEHLGCIVHHSKFGVPTSAKGLRVDFGMSAARLLALR